MQRHVVKISVASLIASLATLMPLVQFSSPIRLPMALLSEESLRTIRGTNPYALLSVDDCTYGNLGELELAWTDCQGQPNGVIDCIRCQDGIYEAGLPEGGLPKTKAQPISIPHECITIKTRGVCRYNTCDGMVQDGFCSGEFEQWGFQSPGA